MERPWNQASAERGTEGVARLRDGRDLAYTIHGDQSLRKPVFYLHGIPGSRHEASLASGPARREGVSLIAIDRPGFGNSTPMANRQILHMPGDIAELADALGIGGFGIIGVSGGGPHAAACAHQMRDRVRVASLVSCPAPLEAFRNEARAQMPAYKRFIRLDSKRLGRLMISLFMRRLGSSPEQFMKLLRKHVPPADQQLLDDAKVAEALMQNYASSAGHDDILTHDLSLLINPWGFDLSGIEAPVHIWHGKADRTVPWDMGRFLAGQLKKPFTSFADGLGHLLILHKLADILRATRLALD